MRPTFERYGWLSSQSLEEFEHHSRVRVVGLVINRQHPNAGGTIFRGLSLIHEFAVTIHAE